MVVLKKKTRCRVSGSGFSNRICAFLACFCQRREHDRQPATCVVVMPVGMMAVTVRAKHCVGLIPESVLSCQMYWTPVQSSALGC